MHCLKNKQVMIGEGRNEVMLLTDSQYEFLSYLITEIA